MTRRSALAEHLLSVRCSPCARLARSPAVASAQTFTAPVDDARGAMARDERARAWSLAEGALSTAAGVPMILATDDPGVRWAGVMTAGFGAVNLGLAIPWLLRLPRDDRPVAGETELETRLRRSRAAHRTATVFAVNVGLDVLYVVAVTVAWILGARDHDEGLRGGGVATLAQGAFLLAFDLWGWIASDRNATRFTDTR
ncbi:MAG: hypothetical protein R3A52_17320 [Polyangiales bacterium]